MTQNNLFMEADDMRLYIDVQPLFIDELENSKNAAAVSAALAAQCEEAARGWKNDIEDYKTGLELFYAQATDGIENSYNDSISGLNSAKNSAISNISSTSQVYINQAKYYAEQAQAIVDNRVSKDHLNQSKGLLTGAVSTDNDVLANVKYYAHSTYCGHQASDASPLDPKKFIKAGSPVITDETSFTPGIASGFSNSNYLTLSENLSGNILKIRIPFKSTSITTEQDLISSDYISAKITSSSFVSLTVSDGVNSKTVATSTTVLLNNKDYIAELIYNKASYTSTINIFDSDGALVDTVSEANTDNIVIPNGAATIKIGYGTNPLLGSVDLKRLEINTDGIPVFSGNKTGIDTIKSDNYTVVGTPVISADGIYQAAGGSNYIYKTGLGLTSDTGFQLFARFCPKSYTGNNQDLFYFGNFDGTRIYLTSTRISLLYQGYIGADSVWFNTSNLGDNEYVNLYLKLKSGSKCYFEVRKDNGTLLPKSSDFANPFTAPTLPLKSHNTLYFGRYDSSKYNNAKIDLNAVKVCDYDGNLVYQPCLKIPYTKSKTGCKVVDSIYRNRVTDMYEQLGYANYYTFDGNNGEFTLPMGEVYGMIEKLRELIIQLTS